MPNKKQHQFNNKNDHCTEILPCFTVTPPSAVTTPSEAHSTLSGFIDNKILVRSTQSETKLSISKEDLYSSNDLLSPISKEISAIEMPYPPYTTTVNSSTIPSFYIHSDEENEITSNELHSMFYHSVEDPNPKGLHLSNPAGHFINDVSNFHTVSETDIFTKLKESPTIEKFQSLYRFRKKNLATMKYDACHASTPPIEDETLQPDFLGDENCVSNIDMVQYSLTGKLRKKLKLKMPSAVIGSFIDNRRSSQLSVNIGSTWSRRTSFSSMLSLSPSMTRHFTFLGGQHNKVSSTVMLDFEA